MTADRLNEYFAGEAGDYLQELSSRLRDSNADPATLLKLATGVRGSIQMAGADSLARLAGRVEAAAREAASGLAQWSPDLRALAIRTVGEIRSLVGAVPVWSEEQELRVGSTLQEWRELEDGVRHDSRPVVPIDTLFFDDAGPHILGIDVLEARPTVPIDTLLFRGSDALREALALKEAFAAAALGDGVPERPLRELVDELFDLLELGLSAERPAA